MSFTIHYTRIVYDETVVLLWLHKEHKGNKSLFSISLWCRVKNNRPLLCYSLQRNNANFHHWSGLHLVATVPEELRPVFLKHQKFMDGLLLNIVSKELITLAREE